MIFNTLPRKFAIAILISCASVMWLNKWHQYVYTRSRVDFPPVSTWAHDSMFILVPVMLAVWIGSALAQQITDLLSGRISASSQSMLIAAILGGMTTIAILLVESSRLIKTGIGNEFVFLASICNRVYPNGNLLLSFLKWAVPGAKALKLHILLKDGANLVLFNFAIIILVIMLMEGFALINNRRSFSHETA